MSDRLMLEAQWGSLVLQMRTTARVRARPYRMAAAPHLHRLHALVTTTTTTATTIVSGSAIASAPRLLPGTAVATTTTNLRPTAALPPGAIATMARGRLRRALTPAVHSLLLTSARDTLQWDEGILLQQKSNCFLIHISKCGISTDMTNESWSATKISMQVLSLAYFSRVHIRLQFHNFYLVLRF